MPSRLLRAKISVVRAKISVVRSILADHQKSCSAKKKLKTQNFQGVLEIFAVIFFRRFVFEKNWV